MNNPKMEINVTKDKILTSKYLEVNKVINKETKVKNKLIKVN